MGFYAPAQIVRDARGARGRRVAGRRQSFGLGLHAGTSSSPAGTGTTRRVGEARAGCLEAQDLPRCHSTMLRMVPLSVPERIGGGSRMGASPRAAAGRRLAEGCRRGAGGGTAGRAELLPTCRACATGRSRPGLACRAARRGRSASPRCRYAAAEALWDARTLVSAPELPLFAAARRREEGAERAATPLPVMPLSEEVIADYQTQRLSLKAHPMSFLRASLAARGFVRACTTARPEHRTMVDVAGIVLIRQRPGSAKGVVFITLEDENRDRQPRRLARHDGGLPQGGDGRAADRGARARRVRRGCTPRDRRAPSSTRRGSCSTCPEDLLKPAIAHGDHAGPLPPGIPEHFRQGHPRDVRVIPKSRDFH